MGDLRLEIYRLIGKLFLHLEATDRQLMNTFNLSVTQYWALVYLDDPQGLPLSELAFLLIRDKSSMTGLVDKLEEEGLAIRKPGKNGDRRYTRVALTEQGRHLRRQVIAAHDYLINRRLERLPEKSLTFLLSLQAFPGLLAITAYYYLLTYLHLLNTAPLIGLALIYAAGNLAFATWNIKGYYDTIPVALEQVAMIDGATQWQAFWRILLPLATPALAASALFMFVGGWNEFALANFILNANSNGSNLTFILGLNGLQGTYTTPWGYFAATAVIISLPLMLLFMYARRFFQSGLTIGGVKE